MSHALNLVPRRVLVLVVFLTTVAAALAVTVVLLIAGVVHTSEGAQSRSGLALREAHVAKEIATAIETERVDSRREACEAQNRRHEQTLRVLNHLLGQRIVGHGDAPKGLRIERERTRRATVLLIDALAPEQSC